MRIIPFSEEYSDIARNCVLDVLSDEGFAYDPLKDLDLEDIWNNYLREGGAFFLALDNGGVVGTSAARNRGAGVCEIKRLYVRKEFRGMGLGLALFRKALEFAEKNYSSVRLKTDKGLKKAISMYLRHGFMVVKENDGIVYLEKTF